MQIERVLMNSTGEFLHFLNFFNVINPHLIYLFNFMCYLNGFKHSSGITRGIGEIVIQFFLEKLNIF